MHAYLRVPQQASDRQGRDRLGAYDERYVAIGEGLGSQAAQEQRQLINDVYNGSIMVDRVLEKAT